MVGVFVIFVEGEFFVGEFESGVLVIEGVGELLVGWCGWGVDECGCCREVGER